MRGSLNHGLSYVIAYVLYDLLIAVGQGDFSLVVFHKVAVIKLIQLELFLVSVAY